MEVDGAAGAASAPAAGAAGAADAAAAAAAPSPADQPGVALATEERELRQKIATSEATLEAPYADLLRVHDDAAKLAGPDRVSFDTLRRSLESQSISSQRKHLFSAAVMLRRLHPADHCLVIHENFDRHTAFHVGAACVLLLSYTRR
jgi:hypothetical protein